jgi:hypothetical protein
MVLSRSRGFVAAFSGFLLIFGRWHELAERSSAGFKLRLLIRGSLEKKLLETRARKRKPL